MAENKGDAVNSAVTPPPVEQAPNVGKSGMFGRLRTFLRDVRTELHKTNWPSRNELTKYVVVVMVTIIAVAVYLYVSDQIAALVMKAVGIAPGT